MFDLRLDDKYYNIIVSNRLRNSLAIYIKGVLVIEHHIMGILERG